MNKIIFEGKTKSGLNLLIRYPKKGDEKAMLNYINTLSQERTFITYQGEKVTLEKEKEYLEGQLEKIGKANCVQLLVFFNKRLIGIASLDLGTRIESHVGTLGMSIAREFRGKGTGTLLLQLLLSEAKEKLNKLKIVTLAIFGNNENAQNMYVKFGFKEYGRLPQGILYKGIYVDDVLMYKKV